MKHRPASAKPLDPIAPPWCARPRFTGRWHGTVSDRMRWMILAGGLPMLMWTAACDDHVSSHGRDDEGKLDLATIDMAVHEAGIRIDRGGDMRPPSDARVPQGDGDTPDRAASEAGVPDLAEADAASDASPDGGRCEVDPERPINGECTNGRGACAVDGKWVCEDTSVICNAIERQGTDEECNSIDDDCDGSTDEEVGPGAACTAGIGICQRSGFERCEAGVPVCDAVPGPADPAGESCNGLDDDCDGWIDADRDADLDANGATFDDTPICAEYMTSHCRLWLGWSYRRDGETPGVDYERAYDTWGACPEDLFYLRGPLRCSSTEGLDLFHLIPVDANLYDADGRLLEQATHFVGNNDKLAWALECGHAERDAARAAGADVRLVEVPALDRWILDHCRVYLAHANGDDIPADAMLPGGAGATDWAPCEDGQVRGVADDANSRCNSTHTDFRFRPMQFPRAVNNDDAVAVAFRCRADDGTPAEQALARSLEADIEVFFAWASPQTRGAMDRTATWAGCGARGGSPSLQDEPLCVGSRGDGAFHGLHLRRGDEISAFGFALKSRPRTESLPRPGQAR